ncbi:MAG: ATP-binding protein [Kiritimatiellia bacterium]|jgi:predicted AAA+ superfamily ATPase
MSYVKRYADEELRRRLGHAGAVLITGPKACGKTETALQAAASDIRMDADDQVAALMQFDPRLVLEGETPRLIDEWQEYPRLWNFVRRAVDDRKAEGQFILTGSANPDEKTKRHSGAGRFSVMRMRPMSLYERGWSSGEIRLESLFKATAIQTAPVESCLDTIAERIIYGGWPSLLDKSLDQAAEFSSDYVSLTAEVDISRVSEKRRDPEKVRRLMQSIARNVSTEASLRSLAADVRGGTDSFKEETAADYVNALERLMIVENLPAWNAHIRSSATLRSATKWHFADPSIACAALGLTAGRLVDDVETLGMMFESLVIRDLRTYSQTFGAKVRHYRDSSGLEVDAIIENADGSWMAAEIKLGAGASDMAAENLLKLAGRIDSDRTPPPSALVVVTGNGFAHRRQDGVFVVPLATLRA